jgi:adenylate cyclase
MSAARRLAAILAADVAGYSRLIGVDEEGTLERLRALRLDTIDPAIREHRGRIVKTTGDGLLIEFASVVDAVRCAIAVQRGMARRNTEVSPEKRIEFRIGINLGDVVAEGDDLLGHGVNVAARLEGIAEPGGICLSRAAYDQARGKIDPARLGTIAAAPTTPAPRLSIVVLPFANLSGDPKQDYLADVITEELTTSLSRISSSFVPRGAGSGRPKTEEHRRAGSRLQD